MHRPPSPADVAKARRASRAGRARDPPLGREKGASFLSLAFLEVQWEAVSVPSLFSPVDPAVQLDVNLRHEIKGQKRGRITPLLLQ